MSNCVIDVRFPNGEVCERALPIRVELEVRVLSGKVWDIEREIVVLPRNSKRP
jgi:hypothetical protein